MKKILLVDDSVMQGRILSRIIEESGHQVFEVCDGLIALELCSIKNPQMIFLDLLMPEMSGQEVLGEIKKSNFHIAVIVRSADMQKTSREEITELGGDFFLNKPIQEEEILSDLGTYLN